MPKDSVIAENVRRLAHAYGSRGTDLSIYARDLYDSAHLSVRR